VARRTFREGNMYATQNELAARDEPVQVIPLANAKGTHLSPLPCLL